MTSGVYAPILADQWLSALLKEDAELQQLTKGVYGRGSTVQQLRNQQVEWPVVVFGMQRNPPPKENYTMEGLAWTAARWLAECIDQAEGTLRAGVVAQRLDELLADAPNTDTSGRIMRCQRVSPIDRAETGQGGLQFQHVGAVYEIWIRET